MSQIALAFEPAPLAVPAGGPAAPAVPAAADPFDATGFAIGWDHARFQVAPPADHLHAGHPVRRGWEAGRAAFGERARVPSRHAQRWLALRLEAWLRGITFDEAGVTLRLMREIDRPHCPVTRAPLAAGSGGPDDGVVVRAWTGAGITPGNLVVLSARAATARGTLDAAGAHAVARRVASGEVCAPHGMDAAAWARLATLLSLAEPLRHAQVACLPLVVLPPNRLRLANPVQGLQALATSLFAGSAFARRVSDFGALMPGADARRHFALFASALLARRLSTGWSAERAVVRRALEDAWTHPVVARRWEQLALRLTRADCDRVVRLAVQRGLVGPQWHWVDDAASFEVDVVEPGVEPGAERALVEPAAAAA